MTISLLPMLSRIVRLTLGLLTAVPLTAQERTLPTVAELRTELASPQPADVAWAAYLAGKHGVREVVPELRATLQRLQKHDPERMPKLEWQHLVAAVLDGLIQTEAMLPATELAPWFGKRANHALILASKHPEPHVGMLLRLLDNGHLKAEWVAACNLLLAARPELLVPKLIRLSEVKLEIFVLEPNALMGTSGSFSMTRGSGRIQRLDGFPPIATYKLVLGESATCRVAAGPQPVRYERQARTEKLAGVGGRVAKVDRPDYALRCLWQLAGKLDGQRSLRSVAKEQLVWRDAPTLRTDVADLMAELRTEFTALLDDLQTHQLVSPETARTTSLSVVVVMHDYRDEKHKKVPLPDFTGAGK